MAEWAQTDNNSPVVGCESCRGTGGRLCCPTHGGATFHGPAFPCAECE